MATRRKANTVHAAGLVQGIVLSPPGSQHVFNLAGPLLLGPLFDIGALIMMLGGMMELLIGINAEGKSLEAVTRPSPRPTSRPLRWTGRPSMDGMWAGPLRSVRHAGRIGLQARELEEVRMAIVGGLDIHRRQITYDWIDTDTGQARHGRIQPATRVELRAWLARLAGQQADFAFEATTGWRYVAEEVMGAGFRAHLAEPADTRALRGPSGAPRPTGPTPATCVTCCCAGRCPSPGSRRATSLTSAPRCGCAKRSWTSAPPGSSASTRCCTTTACRNAPGCSPSRAAPGWPAWSWDRAVAPSGAAAGCRGRHGHRGHVCRAADLGPAGDPAAGRGRLAVMPLVIVTVAVAYVASARLTPAPSLAPPGAPAAEEEPVQAPQTAVQ